MPLLAVRKGRQAAPGRCSARSTSREYGAATLEILGSKWVCWPFARGGKLPPAGAQRGVLAGSTAPPLWRFSAAADGAAGAGGGGVRAVVRRRRAHLDPGPGPGRAGAGRLRMGLPVLAVVAFAQSFGDGVHTSIPAPGLGALRPRYRSPCRTDATFAAAPPARRRVPRSHRPNPPARIASAKVPITLPNRCDVRSCATSASSRTEKPSTKSAAAKAEADLRVLQTAEQPSDRPGRRARSYGAGRGSRRAGRQGRGRPAGTADGRAAE